MSLRSISDIPNKMVHQYLQEAGDQFDRARGFAPYRRMTDEIREFFGNACAYCATTGNLVEDHVTPRNRVHGGLHSWGNVIPACRKCNQSKHGDTLWRDHLASVCPDPDVYAEREARIEQFRAEYRYTPNVADEKAIRAEAEALYRSFDALARETLAAAVVDSNAIAALCASASSSTSHGII